jgi:hypothetical protein
MENILNENMPDDTKIGLLTKEEALEFLYTEFEEEVINK